MKIVCISDTHRRCRDIEIPECDLLIHSGDDDIYDENGVIALNKWFGEIPAKKIIYVPGNHDFLFEEDPDLGKNLLSNAEVLIDDLTEVNGLGIYGSPWVPKFFDWAFMKPDLNLEPIWNKIPYNIDILITHGPPYGILDANSHGYLCGSQTLMKEVYKKEPRYHIFGHIHESHGKMTMEGLKTEFINAAITPVWTSNGYLEKDPIILEI